MTKIAAILDFSQPATDADVKKVAIEPFKAIKLAFNRSI